MPRKGKGKGKGRNRKRGGSSTTKEEGRESSAQGEVVLEELAVTDEQGKEEEDKGGDGGDSDDDSIETLRSKIKEAEAVVERLNSKLARKLHHVEPESRSAPWLQALQVNPTTNLNFNTTFSISMDKDTKGNFFSGQFGDLMMSLIPRSEIKLHLLVLLQLKYFYVVRVYNSVTHDNNYYFLVESIRRVTPYFSTFKSIHYQKYHCNPGLDDLLPEVRRIFTRLKMGCLWLHKKGFSCAGRQSCFLLDRNDNGIVLPYAERKSIDPSDFVALVTLIQTVVKHTSVDIPFDLQSLYNCAKNFSNVPDSFLLCHPFFWSAPSKIKFVYALHSALCVNTNLYQEMRLEMETVASDKGNMKQGEPFWKDPLLKPGNELFHLIYKRTKNRTTGEIAYGFYVDIVRFFRNALVHYKDYIDYKTTPEEEVIEKLGDMYPNVFIDLFESLCKVPRAKISDAKYEVNEKMRLRNYLMCVVVSIFEFGEVPDQQKEAN